MKNLFIHALIISMPLFGFTQPGISGKVLDSQTNEALAGAHIILSPTFLTAISDDEGAFRFDNLKPGNYQLTVSFLGYGEHLQTIVIPQDAEVSILLVPRQIMNDEVVISASRMPVKSPSTYTNIAKEEISKANLGQDMPFLLETTPSLVATSDAGTGIGYTGLKIRGTDITRINVTVNGIQMNDPESHSVYWVNLPDLASSIESIQIQRGVGTSSNGAATFGGSINIQTQSFRDEPYAEINSAAGSFDSFKNSISLGTGLLDGKFAVDARLSKITSDGYVDRAFSDLQSYYVSGGYYSDKSVIKLNLISGNERTYQAWNGTPFDSLETNRTFNPSGIFYNDDGTISYYDNETDNYRQDHQQLIFSHNINRKVNLNLTLFHVGGFGYYENYKQNERFSKYGLDDVIIGNDTLTHTDLIRRKYLDNDFYGSSFSLNYNSHKRFTASLGGGFDYYEGDHYGNIIWAEFAGNSTTDFRWYDNTGIKRQYNIFGKFYYQLGQRINAFADLQVRGIDYKIVGTHDNLMDISQEHNFLFVNPKIGALMELNRQHQSYFSFAIANREPTRSDFRDADADNQPRPERLNNIEIGHNYTRNTFRVNANFYYMDYKDQLVLTGKINNVGSPIFVNVPRSYRIGIELSMGWKLSPQLRWDGNATLSNNRIKNFTEYVDNWNPPYDQIEKNLGDTDISFSPSAVAKSVISYLPAKGLSLSLVSKYVGKQFIDNTSDNSRSLDPYFVNDIRINYTFSIAFVKELSLYLMVNNVLNTDYVTNAWVYRYLEGGNEYRMDGYFPQAGINFLGGVSVNF